MAEVSRQRRWQIKQRELGNCKRCGKSVGESSNVGYCEPCRVKHNVMQNKWVAKNKVIDEGDEKA